MSTDELDKLLDARFGLQRADMVAALRSLPAIKPGPAALSQDHARLLDLAGFGEDQQAYAAVATETVVCLASLLRTAYSVSDVARALEVSQSRVRHRRLARTLWAIPHERTWIFPAMQFEADETTGLPLRQIRGLDQVLPKLPPDLHPMSISGFLQTPQVDLQVNKEPQSPLLWLRTGGDIESVVSIVEAAHWVGS